MERPYIFCHMLTALDGKIMGHYMDTPECATASDVFYDIAFGPTPAYQHQGWISGRVTSDDNFTFYEEPVLDLEVAQVPAGDYVADATADMYYVSIDPAGKLGWKSATLHYKSTTAHVVEVLTDAASNAYKAFLRRLGISYIIAGKERLDMDLAMQKMKQLFAVDALMLGGGAVLNWSFIQAGLCDELSVVLAPVADGANNTPTLFSMKEGLSDDAPVAFALKQADVKEDGVLWLRYTIKH